MTCQPGWAQLAAKPAMALLRRRGAAAHPGQLQCATAKGTSVERRPQVLSDFDFAVGLRFSEDHKGGYLSERGPVDRSREPSIWGSPAQPVFDIGRLALTQSTGRGGPQAAVGLAVALALHFISRSRRRRRGGAAQGQMTAAQLRVERHGRLLSVN